MRDSYPGGVQDQGFLTFNPITERWTSLSIDSTGNVLVASARSWQGKSLVLTARDAEIVGERVTLRQTVERQSETQYRVLNEEQVAGRWVALDEYVYVRQ